MAVTLNSSAPIKQRPDFDQQWVSVQVEADGDKCNFNHTAPADLEGDDLQAFVDGNEDFYKRELLRNMYEGADCYDGSLEDWDKWIAGGAKNAELKKTITTPAQPAVDAVMGERQVVVESEVEEEVSTTEIVEVDGKFIEKTTTETVTKTVSEPQFTEHPLHNEDGTPMTRVVTPAVEAVEGVEGVEAVEATYFEDGDELPDGKAVGDIKTEAVEGIEAVEAVEAVAEVTEPVLHSVPTMESFTISEATEAVEETSETIIVRPESVVEKVAWKDTSE